MNSKNFLLDFTIPQGPTGPANGLNAYGGRYSSCLNVLNLDIATPVDLPLDGTITANNINYTTNGLNILNQGIYEITYILDVTTSEKADITVSIWENNKLVIASEKIKSLAEKESTLFVASTICPLDKDSTIDITISSNAVTEITLEENASIIVKQVN